MTDRDDNGRFASDASPAAVYAAMEPLEPYTTGELATELDIPHRTALKYLNQLADAGHVRKKKPDHTTVIWQIIDDSFLPDDSSGET